MENEKRCSCIDFGHSQCKCIYWAREAGELMNGEEHHSKCPCRVKTRREWIDTFIQEGYEVHFSYVGKDINIVLKKAGEQDSTIVSNSLDEQQLLSLLYEMNHGMIGTLEEQPENDYIN